MNNLCLNFVEIIAVKKDAYKQELPKIKAKAKTSKE